MPVAPGNERNHWNAFRPWRLKLVGTYFELTDRRVAGPSAQGPSMVISVAKKLVPSAVRRNTVKRVVREAWRAALAGSAQQGRAVAPRGWLIRLKSFPGRRRSKTAPGRSVNAHSPKESEISWAAVKRVLRTDVDRLIGEALSAKPRRAPGRTGPAAGS